MKLLFSIFGSLLITSLYGQPIELGKVTWNRNYETALELSKESGKDVLILFQEVPGCHTCRKYGQDILSHPLMVEIIETYFVPLAIYNNKGGADRKIVEKYKEPTWNNPVLRIIDSVGNPLKERLSGKYDPYSVLNYLADHIQEQGKLPEYIRILQDEWYGEWVGPKEITLSMYCFWTGEKVLGNIPGVINTTAGFSDGKEVVKVTYNPKITSPKTIVEAGKKQQCAGSVYAGDAQIKRELEASNITVKNLESFRADKDQNYYLKHSDYRKIELTPMQAMLVNSALGNKQNPDYLLSPRQLTALKK